MSGGLKVLLVDDLVPNLDLLDQFLTQFGYTVVRATSGAQVLEAFAAHKPDLVLMDVMLPNIDGLEATRRIRTLSGER